MITKVRIAELILCHTNFRVDDGQYGHYECLANEPQICF